MNIFIELSAQVRFSIKKDIDSISLTELQLKELGLL